MSIINNNAQNLTIYLIFILYHSIILSIIIQLVDFRVS